jgi:hypothetical protein
VFLVAALPLRAIRGKNSVKNGDSDGMRNKARKSKSLLLLPPPVPGPIHERENGALSERAVLRIRPAAIHEIPGVHGCGNLGVEN